ncbi:ATP-binding protein [Streptomyces sp. NPDC055078]
MDTGEGASGPAGGGALSAAEHARAPDHTGSALRADDTLQPEELMGTHLRRPGQTRRLALFDTRGVVSRCRDFTADALADWDWPPVARERAERVEDVLLLVSELVTNACLHAGGPTELALHNGPNGLRIEVTDRSPDRPAPRPREVSLPGGHGLIVLDRLARSWGSAPRDDGKVVWAEVDPHTSSPARRRSR